MEPGESHCLELPATLSKPQIIQFNIKYQTI